MGQNSIEKGVCLTCINSNLERLEPFLRCIVYLYAPIHCSITSYSLLENKHVKHTIDIMVN